MTTLEMKSYTLLAAGLVFSLTCFFMGCGA